MQLNSDLGIILVVEGDAVLGQVLGRVLARKGVTIVSARTPTEAVELVELHKPKLVLLDADLRQGNGVELAARFRGQFPEIPMIVMADSTGKVGHDSRLSGDRLCRLAKPVDLQELRHAVEECLKHAESPAEPRHSLVSHVVGLLSAIKELRMLGYLTKVLKTAAIVLFALVVLSGFALAMGIVRPPWQKAVAEDPAAARKEALRVQLVPGSPNTIEIPEDVLVNLGIRKGNVDLLATAKKPTMTRPLVMPGSTALDPTRLYRIRARFAASPSSAEVIEVAQIPDVPADPKNVQTVFREIRSGDRVKKDELLVVFNSVDVGNKKNDLIDAIYQLKLDEEVLKRAEGAGSGAVPEVFLWNARRNVQGDLNTINRAVSTLQTWGIAEADIQAARDEAKKVEERQGKHDKSKDALWARVEIRSPDDGVIIERNVAQHEVIADNTTNLFQIAKVDRLSVFANCPEDDLPALESLSTAERQWTVETVGSPPLKGSFDDTSYLIDPNQHTAVVKGHIDNPRNVLRAGQFVKATVELPPPTNVVEIPANAVIEDGQQCILFVEKDAKKRQYTIRRVELSNRFEKSVFVRSYFPKKDKKDAAEEKEVGMLAPEPLVPGERVLQSGVGELKAAYLDLIEKKAGAKS
jgi:cobalt-zinc-cadmium efflux system membrane fusion protein